LKQPFGQKAKQTLRAHIFGKAVTIRNHGPDRYRRTPGRVSCAGLDVNVIIRHPDMPGNGMNPYSVVDGASCGPEWPPDSAHGNA